MPNLPSLLLVFLADLTSCPNTLTQQGNTPHATANYTHRRHHHRHQKIFIALQNAEKKWTMPIRNWKQALNQFAIMFNDRVKL